MSVPRSRSLPCAKGGLAGTSVWSGVAHRGVWRTPSLATPSIALRALIHLSWPLEKELWVWRVQLLNAANRAASRGCEVAG